MRLDRSICSSTVPPEKTIASDKSPPSWLARRRLREITSYPVHLAGRATYVCRERKKKEKHSGGRALSHGEPPVQIIGTILTNSDAPWRSNTSWKSSICSRGRSSIINRPIDINTTPSWWRIRQKSSQQKKRQVSFLSARLKEVFDPNSPIEYHELCPASAT